MPKESISEQDIIQKVNDWDGTITTKLGSALRQKTYTCFNGLIEKLGKELSNAINTKVIKTDSDRIQVIKTILAKHNIYTHEGK